MNIEDFDGYNKVYREFFPKDAPARATVALTEKNLTQKRGEDVQDETLRLGDAVADQTGAPEVQRVTGRSPAAGDVDAECGNQRAIQIAESRRCE